ncbi:MAG: sulfite exporter TauE/SafE family protein [Porticoccaceae bacterium]|nr:sulfite exporter TauE/SafE family protein [Porticoccaceae bacterium]
MTLFADFTPDYALLNAMFVVGLMGAGHCIGMCGGIVAALGANGPSNRLLLGYNLGRILSYSIAGALAGGLVAGIAGERYLSLMPTLRIFAGALIILMGFYIAGWWSVLRHLESAGQVIWRRVQPLAAKLGQPRGPLKAVFAGMLWGWLPCGLVYSALGQSLASGSATAGALSMFAFGLGTLPAMLAGGLFSSRLARGLQSPALRQVMGLGLIALGIFMIWQMTGQGGGHHHHH